MPFDAGAEARTLRERHLARLVDEEHVDRGRHLRRDHSQDVPAVTFVVRCSRPADRRVVVGDGH